MLQDGLLYQQVLNTPLVVAVVVVLDGGKTITPFLVASQ
jgi:hypothetical protein